MSDLELTGSPDTTSTSRHSPKDYYHKKVSHGLMLVVYFGVHTWARIKYLLKDPARISRSNICVSMNIYTIHIARPANRVSDQDRDPVFLPNSGSGSGFQISLDPDPERDLKKKF